VSTAALSPEEIAEPLRAIFRRSRNVRVLMGEVRRLDLDRRSVVLCPAVDGLEEERVPYDTLVVAAGSSYSYFGHDEWRPYALEVKTLDSALRVRTRLLSAFEAAELEPHAEEHWLTFMVVGAGPTGVEMAGQIAELARDTLREEYRAIDPTARRVLLVEATDRILPAFPPSLSARAANSLLELGVTPLLEHTVVGVGPDLVEVRNRDGETERIACRTIVWAAGVTASPLARELAAASDSDVDPAGRVLVERDLTVRGRPEVLAIGDMSRVVGDQALPGIAPVAMQEGRYAGRLIADRLAGRRTPPFRYRDKGNLATIGRARAVADLGALRVGGFTAWVIWLVVHLFYLIGFQNRAVVVVRWAYNFLTRGRSGRLVTHP
jgi:NADH dehydrogenase